MTLAFNETRRNLEAATECFASSKVMRETEGESNRKIKWQSLFFGHKLFLPNEFHSHLCVRCSPSVSVVPFRSVCAPRPPSSLCYFIFCYYLIVYFVPTKRINLRYAIKLRQNEATQENYYFIPSERPTRYMLIWVLLSFTYFSSLLSLLMETMSHPININNHTHTHRGRPPTQYLEICPANKCEDDNERTSKR